MAFSQIDIAIAVGIFLVFIAILFSYMSNYFFNYRNIATTSELTGVASDIFNAFFTGRGVPENWDEQNFTPVKVGLMTTLYRVAINVTETSGTARNNITINGTVNFDSGCSRNVFNNTVRLYDSSNSQVAFQLYDQIFCSNEYIMRGNLVFNLSLSASQTKIFYVYFSPQRNVTASNYSFAFPATGNYIFQAYPAEELQAISIDKLYALQKLNYTDVAQTLTKGYKFNLEISR